MDRRILPLALLVVVVACALTLGVGSLALSGVQSQESRLQAEILHSCERGNVKTANDNASHWADYNVFLFVDERFTVPTKSETAAQKRITSEFVDQLNAAVHAKDWTPLTNCTSAVAASGTAYQAPQPIAFTKDGKTIPPPTSALDPVNAARLVPTGSLP